MDNNFPEQNNGDIMEGNINVILKFGLFRMAKENFAYLLLIFAPENFQTTLTIRRS